MRFTDVQYDAAIETLVLAKEQPAPDGQCCRICQDAGHQAWECGHNPLNAMCECDEIVIEALKMHERLHAIEEKMDREDQTMALADFREDIHSFLHYVGGWDLVMGQQVGPARIIMPRGQKETSRPATTANEESAA